MRVNGYCISPGYCQEILNGDRAGLGGMGKARRNEVLKKFRHWSPTLRQWLSKVQTYRMPNTAASSLFLLSKGHGMRNFISSSCEVVSTQGKNTSKYTEWVNTDDQHLHAYQQLQWGFRRGKGGRSSQASRYLLSGWSTAPFLLVCATVIYLTPTILSLRWAILLLHLCL